MIIRKKINIYYNNYRRDDKDDVVHGVETLLTLTTMLVPYTGEVYYVLPPYLLIGLELFILLLEEKVREREGI